MPITTASSHGIARGRQPFRVPLPGVTPTSSCWATVCEMDPSNQHPIYGDAYLTIEQVVPGNGEVNGALWIDNVPNNIQNRVTVYYDDFMADTPVFTVQSTVRRGHGHVPCPIKDDAFKGHPNVWASVTEIDATGARPIFGDAFLTISQIVPDPVNGIVEVAVWIDNVPNDINYQVTVTGLL
jgi:hypothetical protein